MNYALMSKVLVLPYLDKETFLRRSSMLRYQITKKWVSLQHINFTFRLIFRHLSYLASQSSCCNHSDKSVFYYSRPVYAYASPKQIACYKKVGKTLRMGKAITICQFLNGNLVWVYTYSLIRYTLTNHMSQPMLLISYIHCTNR